MNGYTLRVWFREILYGKTFGRACLNEWFSQILPSRRGCWLDIGGGINPSYLRFLSSDFQRIATDARPSDPSRIVCVDADVPLPFPAEHFHGVLAINMLYILHDPYRSLQNILTVLKPGGEFIATFPFFFPETPEPHDYHRWTHEGAEKILREAGFVDIFTLPIGGAWSVFGTLFIPFNRFRVVRLICAPLIWLGDRFDRNPRITYGWLTISRKPL